MSKKGMRAFILISGMCSYVDCLDKVTTNVFIQKLQKKKKKACVLALLPHLSLCCNRPWDDFVAGKTSLSKSLIPFLFTFCGVIFHISIIHSVMCGKSQKYASSSVCPVIDLVIG